MTIKEWLQRGIEIEEEIADLQAVNPVIFGRNKCSGL